MIKYFSMKQIADRFGVNKQMVIRWWHAGHFPNAKQKNPFAYNSPIVVPESDVEKFAVKLEKAQQSKKN